MFVDAVVDAIEELSIPLWLALDDVHVLIGSESARSLAHLAGRASDRFRLVLASRSDLPIALPLLRVEGRVGELRAPEFAFAPEESRAYLGSLGLDLPPEAIVTLQRRTEGWAAGVRIAALDEVQQRFLLQTSISVLLPQAAAILARLLNRITAEQALA